MAELTIQELEAQYKALGEQIQQKKKDDEEKKKAQLAFEQTRRKKEVDAAFQVYCDAKKKFNALANAYTDDYGYYKTPASDVDGIEMLFSMRPWNYTV